jgi:hypothetical protein
MILLFLVRTSMCGSIRDSFLIVFKGTYVKFRVFEYLR